VTALYSMVNSQDGTKNSPLKNGQRMRQKIRRDINTDTNTMLHGSRAS